VLTLATSASERGELTLLRRADGALELRVNGLFAMDTSETSSERLLGSASIAAAAQGRPAGGDSLRVLVGGLGLGFTVAALLDDRRVAQVVVAEIEPDLVRWHRNGLIPPPRLVPVWEPSATQTGATLGRSADEGGADSPLVDDPRIDVVVADVRDVVAAQPAATYDLVLLDVDNGPGFLLYDDNAAIYAEPFLTACARAVRPGGVAAIWSASEAAALADAMDAVFATTNVQAVPVTLNGRRTQYHLYFGRTAIAEGARHAG
jgi:spermidine synthase